MINSEGIEIVGLKVVHINTVELRKKAEAKAFWENVLKPKWEEQARERAAKLLAELRGKRPGTPEHSPTKTRG